MSADLTVVPMSASTRDAEAAEASRPADRRIDWPVGPEADRGSPRLTLDLAGDRVVGCAVAVGATHRGLERGFESCAWYQVVPIAEGIAPESGSLAATALCRAIEALLEVEVPERAEWLRVLLGEIGRVNDHFARLASACAALGAVGPAAWLRGGRDRGVTWTRLLTGAGTGAHFVRIGGVSRSVPDGLADGLRDVLEEWTRLADDIERSMGRVRSFVDRLRDVAVLEPEVGASHGATGVLMRAAGDATDLRRSPGYSVYPEIDFDVVVGRRGDNYDRFLVCLGEVRQSVRIASQCLDRLSAMGEGPVRCADPAIVWPVPRSAGHGIVETIHHAMGVTSGPRVPPGDAWASVEGANGELGFYVVSDGGPVPQRVRCRAPGFFHARLLATLLRDVPLAEVETTLALANVDATECDR